MDIFGAESNIAEKIAMIDLSGPLEVSFDLNFRTFPETNRWAEIFSCRESDKKNSITIRVKYDSTLHFFSGDGIKVDTILSCRLNSHVDPFGWHTYKFIRYNGTLEFYIDDKPIQKTEHFRDIFTYSRSAQNEHLKLFGQQERLGLISRLYVKNLAQGLYYDVNLGVVETNVTSQAFLNDSGDGIKNESSKRFFLKSRVCSTQIRKLKNTKRFADIVRLTDMLLVEGKVDKWTLHSARAEALFELREYSQALASFEYCLAEAGLKTDFRFFRMARTSSERALNKEARKRFWERCSEENSVQFNLALQNVLENEIASAKVRFDLAAAQTFEVEEVRENWIEAFDKICNALNGHAPKTEEPVRSYKKILVSGMGWSGSGALFDYFKEFPDSGFSLNSEQRYIEGSCSLLTVYKELSYGRHWKRAFLNFFFTAVLGFNKLQLASDFSVMREARKFSLAEADSLKFARAVNLMMGKASQFVVCGDHEERVAKFKTFANEFVNLISTGAYIESFDKCILNNCIHISNLQAIDFIEDITAFAVFRDPRSNYVALRSENPSYRDDAALFIQNQCKKYANLGELTGKLSQSYTEEGKKLVRVQFERFVLDERYREELASIAGLDLSRQDKFKYFKPWESEKNVFLHETWENQDEIRAIEEALPEHCVDVHQLKKETAS